MRDVIAVVLVIVFCAYCANTMHRIDVNVAAVTADVTGDSY